MLRTERLTETMAHGYSSESTQRELSNEYQHDRVCKVFKDVCIHVLCMKLASALERLRENISLVYKSGTQVCISKWQITSRIRIYVCIVN